MNKKIWDISPLITADYPLWPGSQPIERTIVTQFNIDQVESSNLKATVHLGAHADAPLHYGLKGQSIDERDLNDYLGICQVLHLNIEKNTGITKDHFTKPLLAKKILFKTSTFNHNDAFKSDFAAFDPMFFEYLALQEVRTIGIDGPSVDLYSAHDFPCHKIAFKYNLSILENLTLENVPEGLYELIALPLKLQGFDASPVRAILRELP